MRCAWAWWLGFGLAWALPVAVVVCGNTAREGRLTGLTTHGGLNFYMGNHEHATGYPVRIAGFRMTARDLLEDAHAAAERATGRSLTRTECSAWWAARARAYWREKPRAALALFAKKLRLFWAASDLDDLRIVEQVRLVSPWFRGRVWPGFWVFGLGGLLGFVWWHGAWTAKAAVMAGMFGMAVFFVTARHRLEFVPLLAALGAAGTKAAWDALRIRRVGWARPLATAGAAALVFWPVRLGNFDAVDRANASVQALTAGHAGEALRLADEGLARDGANADVWHARGSALFTLERYDEAAESFRRCVGLRPGHATAWYNLALSIGRAGDGDGAMAALREGAARGALDAKGERLLADMERVAAGER